MLTSNGWTSVSGRPLLITLSVTPFGAEFICAIDTMGTTKDAAYLAQTFMACLEKLDDCKQVTELSFAVHDLLTCDAVLLVADAAESWH